MKRAVGKDNLPGHQPTPADRWLLQAAELRARWLPSVVARGFPRLELLRRAAMAYTVNHRWQKFVARFYPQVHLAIQSSLRKTLWPEHCTEKVHSGCAMAPPQQNLVSRYALKTTGLEVSMSSQGLTYRVSLASAKPDSIDHTTTLGTRLGRYTMRQVEVDESRLELAVRHLAHRTRRVEERFSGVPKMVVHKPVPAAVPAERHAPPGPERFQLPARAWDTVSEAPWARAATAPSLNIEQLTDHVIRQIDSRVIAMRERMGRV